MDGEWSFHIILEVEVVGPVEGVEVDLEALIWSATNVVNQVILLVSAERVGVQEQEDVEVGALLDTAGAQVMVVGVTVLVGVPLDAEARHHVVAAIAVLHIAAEKKLHMLMEMDLESVTEAEAEWKRW